MVMGAVGLPFGLLMVMICGAELFTGNTMIMTCAFYEGKVTLPQLLKCWVTSFISESSLQANNSKQSENLRKENMYWQSATRSSTSNTMFMACAFYEGKITLLQLLRCWVTSFIIEYSLTALSCQ